MRFFLVLLSEWQVFTFILSLNHLHEESYRLNTYWERCCSELSFHLALHMQSVISYTDVSGKSLSCLRFLVCAFMLFMGFPIKVYCRNHFPHCKKQWLWLVTTSGIFQPYGGECICTESLWTYLDLFPSDKYRFMFLIILLEIFSSTCLCLQQMSREIQGIIDLVKEFTEVFWRVCFESWLKLEPVSNVYFRLTGAVPLSNPPKRLIQSDLSEE